MNWVKLDYPKNGDWRTVGGRVSMPRRNEGVIYLLVNCGGEVIYVGQTTNLTGRFQCHNRKAKFTEHGAKYLLYATVDDTHSLCAVERVLVERYSPVLNCKLK